MTFGIGLTESRLAAYQSYDSYHRKKLQYHLISILYSVTLTPVGRMIQTLHQIGPASFATDLTLFDGQSRRFFRTK